ncbi:MAG: hypothetical protein AAFP70_16920, partial [Calditrichota bacterium]
GERGRIVVAIGTLAPGESAVIEFSVFGLINGVLAPPLDPVNDKTTVISGGITLKKTQALDTSCNGFPGTAFVESVFNVSPGECVIYRGEIINSGNFPVEGVIISDLIPSYTTLEGLVTTTRGSVTQSPAQGERGRIVVAIGTLAPGESAVIEFSVKLDN